MPAPLCLLRGNLVLTRSLNHSSATYVANDTLPIIALPPTLTLLHAPNSCSPACLPAGR